MNTGTCRSCSAPMIWAKSPAGAALPLDAKPLTGDADPRITPRVIFYRLVGDNAVVEPRGGLLPEHDVYLSHFATCENARSHSKARKSNVGGGPRPLTRPSSAGGESAGAERPIDGGEAAGSTPGQQTGFGL